MTTSSGSPSTRGLGQLRAARLDVDALHRRNEVPESGGVVAVLVGQGPKEREDPPVEDVRVEPVDQDEAGDVAAGSSDAWTRAMTVPSEWPTTMYGGRLAGRSQERAQLDPTSRRDRRPTRRRSARGRSGHRSTFE